MVQNKETVQQLKELSTSLHSISLIMQAQYQVLVFWIYVELFCLVVILITLAFCSKILQEYNAILLSILWFLGVDVVTIMTYFKLRRSGKTFIRDFNKGCDILRIIADRAEWTRYKKELIYKGNNNTINDAVNSFFSVSERCWSPRRSEKRYYTILVRFLPIFVSYISLAFLLNVLFVLLF